jgi:CRISPR-associated protein Csb1
MNDQLLKKYDEWLSDESPFAALVIRQYLIPIEGKDTVIFPPTYAKPKGMKDEEWKGYNIDYFPDGANVCQIDSVGSQANRMEPIFAKPAYSGLIPKFTIKSNNEEINILEAGHRAADAIVRFSNKAPELEKAFLAIKENGNTEPLAKIAPTSIVFGLWDSRSTQIKLPRVVRSVIRAYNVQLLHRSAQYATIAGKLLKGDENEVEVTAEGKESELGLAHVPAPWSHGGVLVKGDIRRDAALNLVVTRALGVDNDEERTLALRRYILSLSLICFTAPQETVLREGCQLIPDIERPADWKCISHDGKSASLSVTHDAALAYAKVAAEAFGVGEDQDAAFDKKAANDALKTTKSKKKN